MDDGADVERLDIRADFDRENVAHCARAGQALGWLGVAISMAFAFFESAGYPQQERRITALRATALAVCVLQIAALRTPWGSARPRFVVYVATLLVGGLVLAMMQLTGGHASTYFGGIGLLMLSTALVMPWPARWTWTTCLSLIALYVAVAPLLVPWNHRLLANNLVSFAMTAVVAGVATTTRERLRRREFTGRRLLEDSRLRLRREAMMWEAVADAGREMTATFDAQRILNELCHAALGLLRCEFSHVVVHDAATDTIRAVAYSGHSPEQWQVVRDARVSPANVRSAIEAIARDAVAVVDFSRLEESTRRLFAGSGMAVALLAPLHRKGRIVGALAAGYGEHGRAFSPEQERALVAIARLGSIALTNAELHRALEEQSRAEREARAVAEAASGAKDEFFATLSHELRTPLNVILGHAEIARDAGLEARARAAAMDAIEDAGRILHEMLSNTLEVSRLQSAVEEPSWEATPLQELWVETKRQCFARDRDSPVALEWSDDVPGGVVLWTDRRRLVTILRNLVSNAVKFTPRGSVRVSVAEEGDRLAFRVADSGIGIDASQRERIFDLFYQADRSGGGRSSGVGLGLYIVKRYAEQIGATIAVDSTPGVGTLFTIVVPVERAASAGAHPA